MQETPHRDWQAMSRVLCAIDGGPASHRVLEWTWQFAEEFKSQVAIVHAIPALQTSDAFFNWQARRVDMAEERIRTLEARTGVDGRILIDEGGPSEVVTAAAARWKADLVVSGRSQEKDAMGRLRMNAYAIIRDSPCPVVSV